MVSYADFWQRYFYRVHKVEAERKRREDLARLAQQSSEGEDDFGWDDLDDDDDDVDVNLGDNGGVPNAETAPSTAEAAAATAVVAESPREEAVDGIVTGKRGMIADGAALLGCTRGRGVPHPVFVSPYARGRRKRRACRNQRRCR